MDEDIHLSFKAGDLDTELCPALLQVVFDTTLNEVHVLKTVRNTENKIIDFRYMLANKAARISAGRTELEGQSFIAEYPNAKKAGLFARLVKVVEMNTVVDETLHFTGQDGTDAWYHIKAQQFGDGLVICREDITGHMIRQATDAATDVVYVADIKSSTITYVNERVKDVFGFDEKHVYETGHNIFIDIIHPDDYKIRMEHLVKVANAFDNEPHEIEIRLKVKDGSYRWFRLREKIYKTNHHGKVTEAIGRATDIHDQKLKEAISQPKAENNLQGLTRRNRELEFLNMEVMVFNTIISTDYRNMLRNLYTTMEYVASKDARVLSDSGKANIRRAQSSIQKMNLMAHDVVAYAELYKPGNEFTDVDLNDIVNKELKEFNEELLQVNAKVECGQLPVVKGLPSLLSLLFHNLVVNAVKFRNEQDQLIITVRSSQIDGMYINHSGTLPATWYHAISISDNGIGFEQDFIKKAFEIFHRHHDRNKYNGSGTGLAICRKIMEMHDGLITLESVAGLGATFNCFFPIEK